MSHDLHCVERVRKYEHVAYCTCGHQSHGPNPGTAEARHLIHVHIADARDQLAKAKESTD